MSKWEYRVISIQLRLTNTEINKYINGEGEKWMGSCLCVAWSTAGHIAYLDEETETTKLAHYLILHGVAKRRHTA